MTAVDSRERLLALREELSERRERIRAHDRDGVPADFAEQVTARENDDVVHALGARIDDELAQIGAALARLERGEYGACTRCGEPIAAARLDALPYAERCADCAN
ncbi:MAG: TraR/DksA family transcriptional regulator [Gammaproteobacteria bacterium]